MNTTDALSNQRNHGMRAGDPANRQTQHDLALKGGAVSPTSPSRWRARKSSVSSIDCGTSSANETTSTATTITEPSHHDTPVIESAMMRTRTNFGDYQFYVPPETKASPYRSPNGAPVSPQRDSWSSPRADRRVPQKLKLPQLPASPERESLEDREHAASPSPLDEKRLQFFDDAASDQVPFDQVWNQQEFTLELDQKGSDEGDDDDPGQKNELDRSVRSENSKPFDEEVRDDKLEVSGSSAFSAFTVGSASSTAAVPPPPPPPPPAAWHKIQPSPRSPRRKDANGDYISARTPTATGNQAPARTPTPTNARGGQTPIQTGSPRPVDSPANAPGSVREAARPSHHEMRDNCYLTKDDIPSDEEGPNSGDGHEAPKRSLTTAEAVGAKKAAEDLSSSGNPRKSDEETDDKSVDSLFDFQLSTSPRSSDRSPVAERPSLRSRSRRKQDRHSAASSEDENSSDGQAHDEENDVKGLRTRAQEAFATRSRFSPKRGPSSKPSSPRKPSPPLPKKGLAAVPTQRVDAALTSTQTETDATTSPQTPAQLSPGPRVSFTAKNTVHHFQHEYDMYSQSESALSGGTYEEKSIGAEVEEAIKDIFMINALGSCNPSPRQIRYHTDTRFERRESELSDNFSDEDDKSDEDSVADKAGLTKPRSVAETEQDVEEKLKSVPSQNEDVFFEAMLSMVEGGIGAIGAMSAAFGFAAGEESEPVGPAPEKSRTLPSSAEVRSPRKERRRSSGNDSSIEDVLDSMSDFILGPDKSESSDDLESTAPRDEREFDAKRAPMPPSDEEDEDVDEDNDSEPQSLEDDPRLLELAKQSALCMHEVLGVQYDESRGVDISDVKFVVVVLPLPLGLIFQEDYSGCWITKIMPKGNADRSGKIEAGDQLAAINGRSSIGMKVDDICAAISVASSQAKTIELTFLRYIGPFQPLQSDGASLSAGIVSNEGVDNDASLYSIELQEDEKPRSTMSVNKFDSTSSKKKGQVPKSPKRGSLRKKFKWLSRGKKQQKAE